MISVVSHDNTLAQSRVAIRQNDQTTRLALAWMPESEECLQVPSIALECLVFKRVYLSQNTLIAYVERPSDETEPWYYIMEEHQYTERQELPQLWMSFLQCMKRSIGLYYVDRKHCALFVQYIKPLMSLKQTPLCASLEHVLLSLTKTFREMLSTGRRVDGVCRWTLTLDAITIRGCFMIGRAYRTSWDGTRLSTAQNDTVYFVTLSPLKNVIAPTDVMTTHKLYNQGAAPFLCSRVQCLVDEQQWITLNGMPYAVLYEVQYE